LLDGPALVYAVNVPTDAHHPRTAQFISRKLIVRFVSESSPQRLVDEAAGVFLGSGGYLRAVVEAILLSPEFLSAPQYREVKVEQLSRRSNPIHQLETLGLELRGGPLGEKPSARGHHPRPLTNLHGP
jgi:Protein of unknown function (DUF1800)